MPLVLLLSLQLCQAREELFPLESVRPGMIGTVRTVMQGQEIIELRAEILGVRENGMGQGKHMIVGKLVDERTALTGAVHGMSGSPLYLEGKLAGALSRRVATFEKDGHCGFTPIHDMLEVSRLPRPQPTTSRSSTLSWDIASTLQRLTRPAGQVDTAAEVWFSLPLAFSHTAPRHRELLAKLWNTGDFLLAEGSLSANWSKPGAPLQPGAPVAAAMAVGDISAAGTGTLTWRDGDRVLAFGHPMMMLGDVTMPMCEAEIITTVPSYLRPYKMANNRRVVGTVVQDRLSAIAGVVGEMPKLPSYDFTVKLGSPQRELHYQGQFVSHKDLTPSLLPSLFLGALGSNEDVGTEFSIRSRGKLEIEGLPPVIFDQFHSGDESALSDMVIGAMLRLAILYHQNFEELKITGFSWSAEVSPGIRKAEIERITCSPPRPKPGQAIVAEVVLRPEYGQRLTRKIELQIPEDFSPGQELSLETASARAFGFRDKGLSEYLTGIGFLETIGPMFQRVHPNSIHEVIAALNGERPSDQLAVRLTAKRPGIQVLQGKMENLPGSVQAVLRTGATPSAEINTVTLSEQILELGQKIGGSASVSLTLD